MQSVQVNRRENVANLGNDDVEFSKQLNFATRHICVEMKFLRCTGEVLLQDLERYHSSLLPSVFGKQVQRAALLRRIGPIVGIKENVRIEEATSAHGARRD